MGFHRRPPSYATLPLLEGPEPPTHDVRSRLQRDDGFPEAPSSAGLQMDDGLPETPSSARQREAVSGVTRRLYRKDGVGSRLPVASEPRWMVV